MIVVVIWTRAVRKEVVKDVHILMKSYIFEIKSTGFADGLSGCGM